MNVRILAVGKLKQGYLAKGIAEYAKRLTRYGRFNVLEVKEESFSEPLKPKELDLVLRKEGDSILAHLTPRAFVFALDRKGQTLTSPELAQKLQALAVAGTNRVDFIIGGSLGLDRRVLKRADLVLSFSQFTLPHQLLRLVLAEQIYRAFTIIGGERYHK